MFFRGFPFIVHQMKIISKYSNNSSVQNRINGSLRARATWSTDEWNASNETKLPVGENERAAIYSCDIFHSYSIKEHTKCVMLWRKIDCRSTEYSLVIRYLNKNELHFIFLSLASWLHSNNTIHIALTVFTLGVIISHNANHSQVVTKTYSRWVVPIKHSTFIVQLFKT